MANRELYHAVTMETVTERGRAWSGGAQCGEISVESRGEKKGKHSVSMTKKLDYLKLH